MNISANRIYNIILLILVAIIAASIIFNKLGATTIWDWDEARRAENALEILRSGEWIVLQYGGKPDLWNLKGPLTAWLVAISFKVFGLNEFALRSWSALFGVGTAIVVYLFGLEMKNRYVGLFAALVLLTSEGFVGYHGARTGDCDVMVTFFLTLTLYLFYLGQRRKRLLIPVAAAASAALGFLVKGLILIAPLIIAVYLLYFGYLKKALFSRETKYALITFFGAALPWFALRFIRGKDFFIRKFQFDIFKRFTIPIEGHTGPWSYYFDALRERGMHWILLILLAISFIYSLYLFKKKNRPAAFLITWIVLYFSIITFIKTKIFWYLIPIYPAISLLIAYNIDIFGESFKLKNTAVAALFLLLMIQPVISIVKYTERIYISPRAQAIKEIKKELGTIDDVYIHKKEDSQAVYFYLHSFVKGNVYEYSDPRGLTLKRNDAVVTFDRQRLNILTQEEDYQLITKTGKIGLLRTTAGIPAF